jgi:hypothetical protein
VIDRFQSYDVYINNPVDTFAPYALCGSNWEALKRLVWNPGPPDPLRFVSSSHVNDQCNACLQAIFADSLVQVFSLCKTANLLDQTGYSTY